jgi:peptidyl-dipeptidase Dcp
VTTNPFARDWETPFGAPDFARIRAEDYAPAFADGMTAHLAEIDAIGSDAAPPSFANTVEALELAGRDLDRVSSVFWNLSGTMSDESFRALERDLSPTLAAHWNRILTDAALFRRIDALHAARESLGLAAEQLQLLDKVHRRFVKGGARLGAEQKARVGEIRQRLAALGTSFSQNVLKDETDWTMALAEADLVGLPDFIVDTARAEGEARGRPGEALVTLLRSSVEPFLTFSPRRDLRERAFRAWLARGDAGGTDNKPAIAETLVLRAELARLLGFPTFAAFKMQDAMARTPERAKALLDEVWEAGKRRAAEEREDLGVLAAADGIGRVEPWDWRYYAEKVRQRRHSLDEAEIKPYFQLESMISAAFDCATRLFGLAFEERHDLPVYHPDVRVFEVRDASGRHVALFYGDYYARPGKRSGAWMSAFRSQRRLGGDTRPIIVNVMNFGKPASGQPALLSFDDARTLFHEFGHALHGMLSDVTYPSLAGTAVARDFVELPSQLYEHWLERPEVLGAYALHAVTGQPMPKSLLERLLAARTFNQGLATVEYCASALVDLAFHALSDPGDIDVAAFEAETLREIGLPDGMTMRHRSPHFAHVFSGDGYAAGYYSYLWSEVLDADAFEAFRETGDIFDAATAGRLKSFIYAAGDLRPAEEAYTLFRGRLPTAGPLLAKRGLAGKAA